MRRKIWRGVAETSALDDDFARERVAIEGDTSFGDRVAGAQGSGDAEAAIRD